jgi:excisionase family DNA binding protein
MFESDTLQLLTMKEVAQRLGICPRTVFTLVQSGELVPVRIGRAVRFDAQTVRRFVDSKKGTGRRHRKSLAPVDDVGTAVPRYVSASELADLGLTADEVRRRAPWAVEFTGLGGEPVWLRRDIDALFVGGQP